MSESTTTVNLRAIREREETPSPEVVTNPERRAQVREVIGTILAFVALFIVAWAGSELISQL